MSINKKKYKKNRHEIKNRKDLVNYCKNYKHLPTIIKAKKRIIAIGDLHGDFKLTLRCLKLANLIDANLNWIGKDTYVVQVGDQVDRCRPYKYNCDDPRATINDEGSDIKILKFFTKLHEKASTKGGAVISLLGNHELMNVLGDMTYVSYEGLEEFNNYKDPDNNNLKFNSGKEARIHSFKPGNEHAKFLACNRLASVIIGDYLFVHAGIIPDFINEFGIRDKNELEKLNYEVRRWLLGLINEKYVPKIVRGFGESMFWTRILGNIPPNINNFDPKCVKYLDPVLDLFDIKGMIIGHTPQFIGNNNGIKTCGNKLLRVDNGASKAFDIFNSQLSDSEKTVREPQVLEIINNGEKMRILFENGRIKEL